MAEINITPFTDVLLVLLIIFVILAAVTTPPGFEKELPKSNPAPSNKPPPPVISVLVNDKGRIMVDGQLANQTTVYYAMYEAAKRKPGKDVQITADAKAPYGIIIRVLDAAKEANIQNVGFVTS